MRLLICLAILLSIPLHAEDKSIWRCTDESTLREKAHLWEACGVGESSNESDARERALASAINEFKQMCEISVDCRHEPRTVFPKRATCSLQQSGGWKCYRLIEIMTFTGHGGTVAWK
jgi:hypothetical protein